jgi:sec-independent protein translocase protein TatC
MSDEREDERTVITAGDKTVFTASDRTVVTAAPEEALAAAVKQLEAEAAAKATEKAALAPSRPVFCDVTIAEPAPVFAPTPSLAVAAPAEVGATIVTTSPIVAKPTTHEPPAGATIVTAPTIVTSPLDPVPAAAEAPAPEQEKKEGLDSKRMSLLEHLSELRTRLRNAAIAFALAMIGSFYLVEKYFDYLTRPVRQGMKDAGHEVNFYAKSLTEPFWVYMKLAIIGGLIVAGPFVFWEVWKFVAPGLYRRERRLALLIVLSTALCFAGGSLFAYFVLCQPAAYYLTKLLTSFSSGSLPFRLDPMIMMDEVANFQMLTLAGCGVAFELPVVLSILGWMGLVSSKGLFKFNRYALVLSVVLGGVLTPSTDPFTQCLLAAPIFGLYNLSILVVWLIERAARKRASALEGAK